MRVACISHGSIVALNRRPYDLLAQRGADLTVLVPERWTGDLPDPDIRYRPRPGGAPVIALKARPGGNGSLFMLRGLAGALRALRPDLLLLDEEPWSLVALQVLRALPGVPLVCYTKQNISKRLPPPFGWIRAATWKRAAQAWAVGETTAQVVRATGYRGPVEVIPHGVEVTRFQPGRDEARRAELGLTGMVIGYAGRLVEEKGVRDLLAAADRLPRQPAWSLLFVGAGPLADRVRAAGRSGPLAGRVTLLPAVPHDEAPGLYRLMDVFALPSRSTARWREQFGRALVEASATRLPIVAYGSGEIPHVMSALGGAAIAEGDVAALSGTLARYLHDPVARARDGATLEAAARERFSQEAVAERMLAALSRAVS